MINRSTKGAVTGSCLLSFASVERRRKPCRPGDVRRLPSSIVEQLRVPLLDVPRPKVRLMYRRTRPLWPSAAGRRVEGPELDLSLPFTTHSSLQPKDTLTRSMSNNNTSSTSLTWFVTGCSGGLGRQLVVSLLARGQKVAASSRKLSSIQDLSEKGAKLFQWDVTDPLDALMVRSTRC